MIPHSFNVELLENCADFEKRAKFTKKGYLLPKKRSITKKNAH